MPGDALANAIACVPAGRWGVGVSGGADSVALLLLMLDRRDLFPHVIHLDHETRGKESTRDATFVGELAMSLSLPCVIARRGDLEPHASGLPANLSARYRALRLELFGQVARRENLAGIALAHHADDQAETIVLRLMRGAGPPGLVGMKSRARVGGMTLVRPLLGIRRERLRAFLTERGQTWREDASNRSGRYARNRVRQWLSDQPTATDAVLALGTSCLAYRQWIHLAAAQLAPGFRAGELADLPGPVARESARQWLVANGAARDLLTPASLKRLVAMATDAATATRQQFPGGIIVRRRSGMIWREPITGRDVERKS